MAEDRQEKRAAEARREIERLGKQGEIMGTSGFVRAARSAGAHLGGVDAPAGDRIEVWGRRIGRGLGVIFAVVLIWWLAVTYL